MILATLLEASGAWRHGYELAQLAGVKSGTLYPLLIRLERLGYLEAQWQPPVETGRPPRHAYRLTATGIRFAQANPPAPETAGPLNPREVTI
ncbi:PadR family transcriptional regulator [Nitrospirillum sp. BR 11752]|uniref:PadR family transcriptional regulator n=1 Tax=Nitrospirillum sp. BR 11752 TaxID=3104293 RepID=UPI002E983CFD|nr:PadR family transcriptional regulator [Nitrospirillum sp. BR 11752]